MNRFGIMLDCSRNAVMKVEEVKNFISILRDFGYNTLLLYMEDTYTVAQEPYFGYFRGKYSKDELKEIVAYCNKMGVDVIPCVQTLAHLNQIFRWADYSEINDTADILLVEEQRTYELIEHCFQELRDCFSSEYIHIGMDEAHMLGLGKYLDKHGLEDRFELLNKHLEKVVLLAEKYQFRPLMWSDMFFRLANHGEYYPENPFVSEKVSNMTPNGVDLVYWDYYHNEKQTYDRMFAAHKRFKNEIWFAGGAWSWMGFASGNKKTMETMSAAMASAREQGITNVFITMWGDDGKECSFYSLLPSLFAVRRFYDGETDMQLIKENFFKTTGESFDAMMSLDFPNYIGGNTDCMRNPCKYMLYSDPFNGYLDATVQEGVEQEYIAYAAQQEKLAEESKYAYLFDASSKLCRLLSVKYSLGWRTRLAYQKGDFEELRQLRDEYEKAEELLEDFYRSFKVLWHKENKPQGFEVQDLRLGGLARRLRSCKEWITDYLDGKMKCIPELEESLLPFYAYGKKETEPETVCINSWKAAATVNVL